MLTRSVPAMLLVALAMFGIAPYFIAQAPYESTMGLVQKIFYFHVPAGDRDVRRRRSRAGSPASRTWCAARRAATASPKPPPNSRWSSGSIVLLSGPLWARKAWGVWWQWDARLTSTLVLWLLFSAYLLLRRFGGPGTEKLAAGVALVRHGQCAVHLLVGQCLAHDAPEDDRRAVARARDAVSLLLVHGGIPAAVRRALDDARPPRRTTGLPRPAPRRG